ncbi:MAG: NUDIX hydrolase [Patescibacteria group bacterium]|nr:NUDIX hydrolase [Patescibacteria group bacterium]
MNQDHPWIGIDAIILNSNSQILLIKRSLDSKAYPGLWGLVSGTVEWGEEIGDAVIREVKEETNLDVEIVKFVGRYYDKKGRHPTKTMICLPHICKIVGGELKADTDADDAKWFDLKEIGDMDLAFDHKQMLKDEGLI